ncbi:hypothetical protein AB0F43_30160 [Kribbella sp. NPDC023972]
MTIPAAGTAELPVTIDPSASLDYGLYGAVSARVLLPATMVARS